MWTSIQQHLFLDVNAFARATPALHEPFVWVAKYGVILFAAALLWSWWRSRADSPRTMAAALWAPCGTLLALAVNQPIGRLFHEPRPYAVLPHVLVLVSRSTDFSFPSDHAVMAGGVAAGVMLAHRRLGRYTVVAAVLLALARVYVGAHYPLDVVAGLLLGALVTGLGFLLVAPLLTRLVAALTHTPLRPLVARAGVTRTGDRVA